MSSENDRPQPCPFCGAKEKVEFLELKDVGLEGFHIYCRFCRATGPIAYKIEDACMKWNRRTK